MFLSCYFSEKKRTAMGKSLYPFLHTYSLLDFNKESIRFVKDILSVFGIGKLLIILFDTLESKFTKNYNINEIPSGCIKLKPAYMRKNSMYLGKKIKGLYQI